MQNLKYLNRLAKTLYILLDFLHNLDFESSSQ